MVLPETPACRPRLGVFVNDFTLDDSFVSVADGSLAETKVDDGGHLCADVLAVSAALLAGPGVGAGPMGLIWPVVCVELYLGGKSKIWSFGFWICFGFRISYLVPPSPSQPPT